MHAIRKKLQSRRGASITFALLLFLVCAVIGSLVLAAGFAAAGRLAKLADSEQRFYAVNSAAELVLSELCGDGNKVTVVGIKRDGDNYTYTPLPAEKNICNDLAKCIVFGTNDLNTEDTEAGKAERKAKFEACADESQFKQTKTFLYEVKVDGEPDVQVEAKFINGYQLNLTVKTIAKAGETEAEQYILPTIILETDSPRGMNDTDTYEYTFHWKTPKG